MLQNELLTLLRRRRSVVSLLILAVMPFVIAIAVNTTEIASPGEGPPFADQISRNGIYLALTSLAIALPLVLPLIVAIPSSDTIAGEASHGTLRSLLVRPASRARLLAVKYVSTSLFALIAVFTLVIAALIAGATIFGVGEFVTFSGVAITSGEAVLRALVAAIVVVAMLAGLIAFGVFVSTLTDQPVSAAIATVAVVFTSEVLDGIPQLDFLDPVLLTHYWSAFIDLFRVPVDLDQVWKGLAAQLAWVAVFISAAWARLTTKDILS